jgi:hypothetical protein
VFADGKKMNHKLAMSLSKQRWAPKTQIGTHKEMYEAFLVAFQASDAVITAALAEPEEEPEEEPAHATLKAATKAVPKASAVPAPLKAAKAAAAHAPPKAAVAVATPPKAAAAAASLKPATPPKKTKANTWTCEDDGNVHEWEYKGKKYARNFQNQVWEYEDGEVGSWAGVFDGKKIDASAAEPLYVEDE